MSRVAEGVLLILVSAAAVRSAPAEPEGKTRVAEQQAEMDSLKKQVQDQQRQIEQLRAALEKQSQILERLTAGGASPASPQVTSVPAAAHEQLRQTATKVDKPENKPEGASKGLGGVTFSGDLRFRTDAILRSSNSVAGPQQNVRQRYRIRLNVDKELSPAFVTHLQLSSGPANNPLTFDTDFSGITARHPFLISEVFADYHPNKNISFRIGRMPEVFSDNSRFLFDDDIRFNGFQQIVRLPLKRAHGSQSAGSPRQASTSCRTRMSRF